VIDQRAQIRAACLDFADRLADILVLPVLEKPGEVTLDTIVRESSRFFGIDPCILFSSERQSHVVEARHIVMYIMRELLKWSYPELARNWGCDHTTVLAACRKINAILKDPANPRYQGTKRSVDTITERV